MKNLILTICISLLGIGTMGAQKKKETRSTEAFTKIAVSNAIDIYFTQGTDYTVLLEADQAVMDLIVTKVEKGTLFVGAKKEFSDNSKKGKSRKIYISAPYLEEISIYGASDFNASVMNFNTDLKINAAGASDLKIGKCSVKSVQINIAESSDFSAKDVNVDGTLQLNAAKSSDVKIRTLNVTGTSQLNFAGSSDCSVEKMKTSDCKLAMAGASDVSIKFADSGNLSAVATGRSNLKLAGKVSKLNILSEGGSKANIKNLLYSNINEKSSEDSEIEK